MNKYGYGEKWRSMSDPEDDPKSWHTTYYVSFRLPNFVPSFIGWGLLWLVVHIHHPLWLVYQITFTDRNPYHDEVH